jgi:hypothetical protein
VRTLVTSGGGGTLRRDLALIARIAGMLFQYATAGGRLRRAYRRCQARGETFFVDAGGPTHHREETLRTR